MPNPRLQGKITRLRELTAWDDEQATEIAEIEIRIEDLTEKKDFTNHPVSEAIRDHIIGILKAINAQLISSKGMDHLIDQKKGYEDVLKFFTRNYDADLASIDETLDDRIKRSTDLQREYLDDSLK